LKHFHLELLILDMFKGSFSILVLEIQELVCGIFRNISPNCIPQNVARRILYDFDNQKANVLFFFINQFRNWFAESSNKQFAELHVANIV